MTRPRDIADSINRINSSAADATAVTIDSSEQVGIGTTSPAEMLHVFNASANINAIIESGDANAYLAFKDNSTSSNAHVFLGASGDNMTFFSGGSTERMRLMSDGTLLIAQTADDSGVAGHIFNTNGSVFHVRDGGLPFVLNRLTDNGALAAFRKDGTTVGSLGIDSGGFYIDGEANHTGLRFKGGAVTPRLNAAQADNTVALGNATERFSNLYLGGSVYLGGTGSANALDDYEEGDWTPGITGMTFSSSDGVYTKIGRRVQCSGILTDCTSGTASAVGAKISGLPFTVADHLSGTSLEDGGLFYYFQNLGVTTSTITVAPDDGTTEAFLYRVVGGGSTTVTTLLRTAVDASDFTCRFSFTYNST